MKGWQSSTRQPELWLETSIWIGSGPSIKLNNKETNRRMRFRMWLTRGSTNCWIDKSISHLVEYAGTWQSLVHAAEPEAELWLDVHAKFVFTPCNFDKPKSLRDLCLFGWIFDDHRLCLDGLRQQIDDFELGRRISFPFLFTNVKCVAYTWHNTHGFHIRCQFGCLTTF